MKVRICLHASLEYPVLIPSAIRLPICSSRNNNNLTKSNNSKKQNNNKRKHKEHNSGSPTYFLKYPFISNYLSGNLQPTAHHPQHCDDDLHLGEKEHHEREANDNIEHQATLTTKCPENPIIRFLFGFLASPDALEVIVVTHLLTDLLSVSNDLTWLMWP